MWPRILLDRLMGWPFWAILVVLVCAGAIAGFGQAPHELPFLTVALLGLGLWVVTHTKGARRFWAGWALGTGYFGHVMAWIIEPFLVDFATHGWMAAPALFLMAGGLALFWGVAARLSSGIWSLALALALAEIARSFVLSGLPWGLVGYSFISTPLYQAAQWIGPHGVTAVVFGLAACIGTLRVVPALGAIIVTLVVWVWPPIVGPQAPADAPVVRILAPNVLQAEKWAPETRALMYQRHLDLSRGEQVPDLVVWPESGLTQNLTQSRQQVLDAAGGASVLLGYQYAQDFETYYNAASVLLPGGSAQDDPLYLKSRLVPFGEYIPLAAVARRVGLQGLADQAGVGFQAGPGPQDVTIPGIGSVQILICYEGIFPHFVGRLDMRPKALVLITNDAWFGSNGGPQQHLAQARARAIEQGLPVVRSANRGISAMIDARGHVVGQVPFGKTDRLDMALPPPLSAPLYSRMGDLPVILLIVLAWGFAFAIRPKDDAIGLDPEM